MTRPEDMLDDPDAPISEEEKAAAEELRLALEDPARANEDAELLRAASLAHEPRPIGEAEHRAIVARALRARPARRRAMLAWGAGAAAGALALAAAVALLVGPLGGAAGPAAPAAMQASARVPLVQVRSTQPLFSEPFARAGGTSARVDRIALAREADLRDNQFALWGVK